MVIREQRAQRIALAPAALSMREARGTDAGVGAAARSKEQLRGAAQGRRQK